MSHKLRGQARRRRAKGRGAVVCVAPAGGAACAGLTSNVDHSQHSIATEGSAKRQYVPQLQGQRGGPGMGGPSAGLAREQERSADQAQSTPCSRCRPARARLQRPGPLPPRTRSRPCARSRARWPAASQTAGGRAPCSRPPAAGPGLPAGVGPGCGVLSTGWRVRHMQAPQSWASAETQADARTSALGMKPSATLQLQCMSASPAGVGDGPCAPPALPAPRPWHRLRRARPARPRR